MEHEHTRPPGEKTPPDKTAAAVKQQLVGMAVPVYELSVRSPAGRMIPATMHPEEADDYLSWLKYQNRFGSDIYIRPHGSMGIVLVDDLTRDQVKRMLDNGDTPSVVTETSPANYQAWVRLSSTHLPPSLATEAARLLAESYEADPRAADFHHYGRLAGFTNRKEAYRRADGTYPFVRLRYSKPIVAPRGTAYLEKAGHQLQLREQQQVPPDSFSTPVEEAVSDLAGQFHAEVEQRLQLYPGKQDYSRMDYAILKQLALANPAASPAELMQALLHGSPQLVQRKAGHVDDYVRRTVYKVLADPRVREKRASEKR